MLDLTAAQASCHFTTLTTINHIMSIIAMITSNIPISPSSKLCIAFSEKNATQAFGVPAPVPFVTFHDTHLPHCPAREG